MSQHNLTWSLFMREYTGIYISWANVPFYCAGGLVTLNFPPTLCLWGPDGVLVGSTAGWALLCRFTPSTLTAGQPSPAAYLLMHPERALNYSNRPLSERSPYCQRAENIGLHLTSKLSCWIFESSFWTWKFLDCRLTSMCLKVSVHCVAWV